MISRLCSIAILMNIGRLHTECRGCDCECHHATPCVNCLATNTLLKNGVCVGSKSCGDRITTNNQQQPTTKGNQMTPKLPKRCQYTGKPTKGGKFKPGNNPKLKNTLIRLANNGVINAGVELVIRGWFDPELIKPEVAENLQQTLAHVNSTNFDQQHWLYQTVTKRFELLDQDSKCTPDTAVFQSLQGATSGTQPIIRTVSYSELASYRQCPFKHELGYKQRWESSDQSPALAKGSLFHLVMAQHYEALRDGQSLNQIKEQLIIPMLYDEQSGNPISDHSELIEWIYDGYVAHWGTDSNWEILEVEKKYVVALPDEENNDSEFNLKFVMDLVVRDRANNQLYIVDHKTGKDLPKDKELEIDDQFGLYMWGVKKLGIPAFAAIHNSARTLKLKTKEAPLTERFLRSVIHRTDTELDNLALDAYRQAKIAYATPEGKAPKAPDSQTCKWKCEFLEPCIFNRKGENLQTLLVDYGFQQNEQKLAEINNGSSR